MLCLVFMISATISINLRDHVGSQVSGTSNGTRADNNVYSHIGIYDDVLGKEAGSALGIRGDANTIFTFVDSPQ